MQTLPERSIARPAKTCAYLCFNEGALNRIVHVSTLAGHGILTLQAIETRACAK